MSGIRPLFARLRGVAVAGVLGILALAAVAPSASAQEWRRDGYWHGDWRPAAHATYYRPRPYYYHPRPVYYAPRPVYYGPPVYVGPPPVYYPAPVYYAPTPFISIGIPPLVFNIR